MVEVAKRYKEGGGIDHRGCVFCVCHRVIKCVCFWLCVCFSVLVFDLKSVIVCLCVLVFLFEVRVQLLKRSIKE